MVKKVFTLLFLLLAAAFAFAQTTQTGYAKTKGRMDSQGNLIPGSRIGGVSIQLTGGHSTVADANGDFTLTAPDRKFYLSNVQKQGYVLTDPDVLKKQYTCSPNPLVITMETPEKQADDQLAAEWRLWNQLQKQLEQREEELKSLKAINKITEDEYRQALQNLYDNQANNESLISDMAKRYAELDYDLLDEFYRQVMFCIENGDWVKADSLLRSRGNVQHLVQEHLSKGQIIQQQEEKLQKDKMEDDAKTDDLGRLCYSYYEKFAAQFENDSAAYYLELRANLDTTNVEWQLEAGSFIDDYIADYDKALAYYQRALRHALSKNGENHPDVATCYNLIGNVYKGQNDSTKALEYYQKALGIYKVVYGDNHPNVAIIYSNIGNVYSTIGQYDYAMEYHKRALSNLKSVFGDNHSVVANIYNNIGTVYCYKEEFDRALACFQKALNIKKSILGEKHPEVATVYNNIGHIYELNDDYTKTLEYYQKALSIWIEVRGEKHPDIATIYNNLGSLFDNLGDSVKALEYYQKALAIRIEVRGENHPNVATVYNNIGTMYLSQGNIAQSLQYFQKAMSIWESFYGKETTDAALIYLNIGVVYKRQGNYAQALEYFTKALAILETFYEENQITVGVIYNNIGSVYEAQGNYALALENYQKAVSIQKQKYFLAKHYNNIGSVYDNQGDYVHALEYYQKALDIRKSVLREDHPETKNTANRIELIHKKLTAQDSVAMQQYVFTITFGESDGQNLSGEYIVLEYGDWSIDSAKSLYDVQSKMEEKPITILIMKDEVISQHTFENGIGGTIDLKQVGKKEKAHIIRLYHNYKQ